MTTENKPPEKNDAKAIPGPVRETISPSGIDLRPQPEKSPRISKKAGGLIVVAGLAVLTLFMSGGVRRQRQQTVAAAGSPYRKVEPARPDEVEEALSAVSSASSRSGTKLGELPAGTDDPNQFEKQSTDLPKERIVVRRASTPLPVVTTALAIPIAHEPTPEERAISCWNSRLGRPPQGFEWDSPSANQHSTPGIAAPGIPTTDNGGSQLAAIARALTSGNPASPGSTAAAGVSGSSEYDSQTLQPQKEAFLTKGRTGDLNDDYLKSVRVPPISRFEIQAGWEIPAALEQVLNSDLPGESKALVMSNVYDTATGQYLLIPQRARLVGTYNSRVGYGQDGVQVSWQRVIFPDGSTIDLNGMEGLDAQGNAGLRDKVDHHYKQLLGTAVLTSNV